MTITAGSPHTRVTHCGLRSLAILFILILFSGCDALESNSRSDTGAGTSAVVAGPTASQASVGFDLFIPAPQSTKGDFLFHPVEVPTGGEYIVELLGGKSPYEVLARVLHQGLDDGRTQVGVDFSALGGGFTVEMVLGSQVQRTDSWLSSTGGTVGTLREAPTSFHYEVIEQGGEQVIVVAVDYERAAVGGGGTAWITPTAGGSEVPCSDLKVTPTQPLGADMAIAGVRMRGIGVKQVEIVEQTIK